MEVKGFEPRSRRWEFRLLITTVLVLMCGDLKFYCKQNIFYKNRQNNCVPSRDLGYQALGWGIRDNLIFSNLMPYPSFLSTQKRLKVFQGLSRPIAVIYLYDTSFPVSSSNPRGISVNLYLILFKLNGTVQCLRTLVEICVLCTLNTCSRSLCNSIYSSSVHLPPR